jgi:hypothetical protein
VRKGSLKKQDFFPRQTVLIHLILTDLDPRWRNPRRRPSAFRPSQPREPTNRFFSTADGPFPRSTTPAAGAIH